MTLPRLEAIVKHWDEVPPLAVSAAQIASTLGVAKPRMLVPGPSKRATAAAGGDSMTNLAQALTGVQGFVVPGGLGV